MQNSSPIKSEKQLTTESQRKREKNLVQNNPQRRGWEKGKRGNLVQSNLQRRDRGKEREEA
ncbi:hypothetical protein CW745_06560 [Psychromonas sp. psych-6C06]|nr:hypothetical protein CW745_06560 [Psychromonas sp. psych-6C06]